MLTLKCLRRFCINIEQMIILGPGYYKRSALGYKIYYFISFISIALVINFNEPFTVNFWISSDKLLAICHVYELLTVEEELNLFSEEHKLHPPHKLWLTRGNIDKYSFKRSPQQKEERI
jgi:hypothetical protein